MLIRFPQGGRVHGRASTKFGLACSIARVSSVTSISRPLANSTISHQRSAGIEPRARQELTVDAFNPSALATMPVPPNASMMPAIDDMDALIVRNLRTGQEFANSKTAKLGKCVAIRVMLDPPKITGPRLRRLRYALDFPEQKPFAKALGLGKSTYSELENGVKPISIKTADKLWIKFRIPLPYIYYGDESQLSPGLRQKIDQVA